MLPRSRKLAGATLTASLVALGAAGTTALSIGAAHAATCPTASQIVSSLNAIGAVADSVNTQVSTLTTSSSGSAVVATSQAASNGLNTMNGDFNSATADLNGCPALSAADSDTVAAAFSDLTNRVQTMSATLIGRHAMFAQFTVTAPTRAAVTGVESAGDSYAYTLIAGTASGTTIPSSQTAFDNSVGNTVSTYSQICIPSPLYPIILPVCASA